MWQSSMWRRSTSWVVDKVAVVGVESVGVAVVEMRWAWRWSTCGGRGGGRHAVDVAVVDMQWTWRWSTCGGRGGHSQTPWLGPSMGSYQGVQRRRRWGEGW